jgi:3-oxoacyl-[acyl-carrier protein] reductase
MAKLSRSIAGKVAVITGAASGMGRATAVLFGAEQARVAAADRDAEGAAAVAKEIVAAGGDATPWTVDVSEPEAIEAFVGDVIRHYGTVDILVNNAGISVVAPIRSDNYEQAWASALAVNLTAYARLARACVPHLGDGGRIVNVASTEGLGATASISPYTASKHGVIGLTRSLAVELGREGITVNCICPGCINTNMTAAIPDEAKEKFARRRVPLRRYGEPEEVANATLSLVLPASSYINGAVLVVDGGMTAQNT